MIKFDNVSHLEIDVRRWHGDIRITVDGVLHEYRIGMESGDGMWMCNKDELDESEL